MNNNKKLWTSVALTALIAFPAGWALGGAGINKGLVNALGSVGENLFGEGNFAVSVVDMIDGTGTLAVQIDVAQPPEPVVPPDPVVPVLLNVFQPPDPVMPGASCVATAQIAVTSAGVRVVINPDVMPIGGGIIVDYDAELLLGAPPNPCRDGNGNVIGPGPG